MWGVSIVYILLYSYPRCVVLWTAELMEEVRIAELSKPMGCHKLGCVSNDMEEF